MEILASFSRKEVINALMLGTVLCKESIRTTDINKWYEMDCVKKAERRIHAHAISIDLVQKEELKLSEEISLMSREIIGFVKDSDIYHDREEQNIKVYNIRGDVIAEVAYDNMAKYTAYKDEATVVYDRKWRNDKN